MAGDNPAYFTGEVPCSMLDNRSDAVKLKLIAKSEPFPCRGQLTTRFAHARTSEPEARARAVRLAAGRSPPNVASQVACTQERRQQQNERRGIVRNRPGQRGDRQSTTEMYRIELLFGAHDLPPL
jgi:hypothetical protein